MASRFCSLSKSNRHILFTILILVLFSLVSSSVATCESKYEGTCHDKREALKLKIIAIFSILMASIIGVCLPILSRFVPAFSPDRNLFVLVKAFSSGVILATGYMHVLPDSFDDLRSECLPENPWHKFPFTTFVAMLAAIFTLMVDSFSIAFFKKKLANNKSIEISNNICGSQVKKSNQFGIEEEDLLKKRVVAQVY